MNLYITGSHRCSRLFLFYHFFRIQESYLLKHLPVSDFPVVMQLRIIFYAKNLTD